jgi:hypothetical protein
MLGHQFMQQEFGVTPQIGWNLMAYGHSATNARLYSDLGYKAQFFAKIDTEVKSDMSDPLNFLWQPSANLGNSTQILTHIFHDKGIVPDGFQQDAAKPSDDPFDDNPKSSEYNAPDMSANFVNALLGLADKYPGVNNLIQVMGNQNYFENAQFNYMNMEKIMNYVSKNYKDLNMNIVFSTPSEYLAALEAEKKEFPVFTGDLIQLADANIITNGYYSSKPDLKRAIKTASAESHV